MVGDAMRGNQVAVRSREQITAGIACRRQRIGDNQQSACLGSDCVGHRPCDRPPQLRQAFSSR